MAFVVFDWQTTEVSCWRSLSMLQHFSKSEAFAGEALVLREISFFIFLSLIWTSDIFSHLTLKIMRIPLGTNIYYLLTNYWSFRVLLQHFDWLANQMRWLRLIRFWLVIQSNHNLETWLIKGPSLHLVGEYRFSHQPKQRSKIWIISPKIWPFYSNKWARDVMI